MAHQLEIMKKDVVDVVGDRIRSFQETGELSFPPNYSPENAMKAAWLILQETKAKVKVPGEKWPIERPALEVCTKNSVANALLSMVVQGLNPQKKQCYFIAYGDQLTCQRSYFGSIYIAKQVNPDIEDIVGEIVFDGDIFEFEKRRGKTVVTRHVQKLENIDKSRIRAAYATILYHNGTEESVIMTLPEVYQAWGQSKQNVFNDDGTLNAKTTHSKFTGDMCKRTVINKACKIIINSSDDSNLIIKHYNQADVIAAEAEAKERIEAEANTIMIDENGEVIDITNESVPIEESSNTAPAEPESAEMMATDADGQATF